MKQSVNKTDVVQDILFEDAYAKRVVMEFSDERQSNDGGLLLLGALDRSIGVTEGVASNIFDIRNPNKSDHTLLDLIRQRAYGLLGGYPDCNDAGGLRNDPVMRTLLDKNLSPDEPLASQPTLSRLENNIGTGSLMRAGLGLMDLVIARLRQRHKHTRRITIDLDPTDDPTHGQQLFSFFNGYYDSWCYLPLVVTVTCHDRHGREQPEQHVVAILLRRGNAKAHEGADSLLRRLVPRLRKAFKKAAIRVRADGGFAAPDFFDVLEDELDVEYVINVAKNSVLKRRVESMMKKARKAAKQTGKSARVFGEVKYAARSWKDDRGRLKKRRVVVKAEVTLSPREPDKAPKDNPRFVVTNLKANASHVYRVTYCRRGEMENRIKELHAGVFLDRTSCHSFTANQFRVLLATAAYVLAQEFRHLCQGTEAARWQVPTLRERLLKFGAIAQESCRQLYSSLRRTLRSPRYFRNLDKKSPSSLPPDPVNLQSVLSFLALRGSEAG